MHPCLIMLCSPSRLVFLESIIVPPWVAWMGAWKESWKERRLKKGVVGRKDRVVEALRIMLGWLLARRGGGSMQIRFELQMLARNRLSALVVG